MSLQKNFLFLAMAILPAIAQADPCGMVPPIYTGPDQPIVRTGLQQTYVFHKDGVETFVIRPGYTGKVDEFGMLIPFPSVPAIRKVPDHIFPHLAAAVDPPEVVVDLRPRPPTKMMKRGGDKNKRIVDSKDLEWKDQVRVVKQEAVGMYEVAVLEAGSAAALKKWIDEHGYNYPDGMDKVCDEYVADGWCFVAVKTKVGQKEGVEPTPGQRKIKPQLPQGASFDGNVQAMGFRFESEELVVPMRLSAFNDGELRNIVYLLTDGPRKIRSIPEEYVVRQISGDQLHRNVTDLLPLRILGGTEADFTEWHRKNLPAQRNPEPKNGAAKQLFASDLKAVASGELSLEHEEQEKELLAIGEALGLRGAKIDALHEAALAEASNLAVADAVAKVEDMTLTMVDGEFPREVLGQQNLQFAEYRMSSRRNKAELYDAKTKKPAGKKQGVLKLGALDRNEVDQIATAAAKATQQSQTSSPLAPILGVVGLTLLGLGLLWNRRRLVTTISVATVAALLTPTNTFADPCGMVPPIYTGPGQPITRIGDQMTYVFYKDGVETFVIRPGFEGKVDEFGMLIPFPSVPAIRKVPDHIFSHVQAAIDPPEVVIDLRPRPDDISNFFKAQASAKPVPKKPLEYRDRVVVIKQEAVGMYEVAVLEAGSAKALKRWLDEHGYVYPKGMDKPCNEYVESGWCFVAVKTKVGQKDGVDPKPAQRNLNSKLPEGSVFDGNVQGMGFRFESDELVVPMRLSAFNAGELHNIVYIATDKPQKIRSIPEEYVMRQISGAAIHRNVTAPLPLRIIGGTEKDLTDWHKKNLPAQRNPEPKNGAAKELFAGDLKAIASGELSLEHEEKEKELLSIGERLGLRGKEIDRLHAQATSEMSKKATEGALEALKTMSLTVVDGDFPRDVLARKNLQVAAYQMPARRNNTEVYDAKTKRGSGKKDGVLLLGAVDWSHLNEGPRIVERERGGEVQVTSTLNSRWFLALAALGLIVGGFALSNRISRQRAG